MVGLPARREPAIEARVRCDAALHLQRARTGRVCASRLQLSGLHERGADYARSGQRCAFADQPLSRLADAIRRHHVGPAKTSFRWSRRQLCSGRRAPISTNGRSIVAFDEVFVPIVDCLELAAVDGDARRGEKTRLTTLTTEFDKTRAHLAKSATIFLAKI